MTTQTTRQESSITERLRTDLGRSVGVTMVTQLVWLTLFTGPTFPLPATAVLSKGQTCTLKIVNKPPYIDNKSSEEVIKIDTRKA